MTLGELKNRIRFLDDNLEVVVAADFGKDGITELEAKDLNYIVSCGRGRNGNKGKVTIRCW